MSKKRKNKLMSAKEAVETYIRDGDTVSMATFLCSSPFSLIHEIIRQKKKDLTVVNQSGIEELEQLIAGGCMKRVITAFNFKPSVGEETGFTRAIKEGRLEVEDYSNFTLLSMLMAGAQGNTFAQVIPAIMHSDVFKKRTFMGENKFRVIKCPYTGADVVTVPALRPDVAILHAQRADKFGNVQYWGAVGNTKWAALASEKIIVSVEEIVDESVIRESSQYTIIPGFRVDAVVHEPWGGHPSDVLGYYIFDKTFRSLFFAMSTTAESTAAFMDEWVYGVKDRNRYIEKYIEKFGLGALNSIKATYRSSGSVNIGTVNESYFDDEGYCRYLDTTFDRCVDLIKVGVESLTMDEIDRILKEGAKNNG
ncbi:MAG: CoA transferase subunit A [Bacillota bacterium]